MSLRRLSAGETADIYAPGALIACSVCASIMSESYPLWGLHLQAAVTLHAAHRAVTELCDIPALTPEDRLFGRKLVVRRMASPGYVKPTMTNAIAANSGPVGRGVR